MVKSSPKWLSCSVTKARLNAIDDIIKSKVVSTNNKFNEIVLHTLKMGGKKLRPSLFLLSLNTGNYYGKELLHPAAALELIHIASLYHDDVMDRAELRRNAASVNANWGNLNATYSGNYLFSRAISILSDFSERLNLITCQYISKLCLGQLKEAENAYNIHVTREAHIEIIKSKTASLFELPCKLGGMLAGADDDSINALATYSDNIGIAFQLIDDLLDLKGTSDKIGKNPGTDLKEGVYSYATIHALNAENSSGELTELLLIEELEDADIQRAIEIIKIRGGIQVARQKAQKYIREAMAAISFLPESETKKSFINLANFIILRDH